VFPGILVVKPLTACFRLCDPIDVLEKNDVSNLYESLAGNFAGVAQYNGDNRQFEGVTSGLTLDSVCAIMVNESLGTPVKRYSLVNEMILEEYSETCLDYKYDKMITDLGHTDWRCEAAEKGGNALIDLIGRKIGTYSPPLFNSYFSQFLDILVSLSCNIHMNPL
jgi:hypothetical protein